MKEFSIGMLEQLSGVKGHTIRMWESRYRLLKPSRRKGNFRYYDLEDVKYLLTIAQLNRHGFKISLLAQMDPEVLEQKAMTLQLPEARAERSLAQLLISLFTVDIEGFENVLDVYLSEQGIQSTIQELIIPFLERAHILSYEDQSNEVHFVVTALRKKLILGIEKAVWTGKKEKTILLFLPLGEHYDLVLLYLSYLLKSNGYSVLYLGTNISQENAIAAIHKKKPHGIVTYLPPKGRLRMEGFSLYVKEYLPQSFFFVTSSAVPSSKGYQEDKVIHYRDLLVQLKNLSPI